MNCFLTRLQWIICEWWRQRTICEIEDGCHLVLCATRVCSLVSQNMVVMAAGCHTVWKLKGKCIQTMNHTTRRSHSAHLFQFQSHSKCSEALCTRLRQHHWKSRPPQGTDASKFQKSQLLMHCSCQHCLEDGAARCFNLEFGNVIHLR